MHHESDSDMAMIEYTMWGEGRRLWLFVHHTDAEREFAYDRDSHVGTLDKALDQADAKGWIIVDMKEDWKHQTGYLSAFVELRDLNYPGSTYTLAYHPAQDQLVGIYFQAVMKQKFNVEFERTQ